MIRRPPVSTRTDTLVPYTTPCRSAGGPVAAAAEAANLGAREVKLGCFGGEIRRGKGRIVHSWYLICVCGVWSCVCGCLIVLQRDGLKLTIPPKTVGGNKDDWSPEVVKIDKQMPRSTTKEPERHQTPLRTRPSSTGKVRTMGDAGPSGAQRLLGKVDDLVATNQFLRFEPFNQH